MRRREKIYNPARGLEILLAVPACLVFCMAFLPAVLFASSAAAAGQAEAASKPTIADAFVGEDLHYRIGFWIFNDVAEGRVTLEKGTDNDYVATLSAWTTGLTGWALKYRKDTFVVHMTLTPDGQRFVSRTFEKMVDKSGDVRMGLTVFDYDRRLVTWRSWGGEKEARSGSGVIPPGTWVDDPLTAFYNFRYGAYGPVKEGMDYTVYTFPKGDDVPRIMLRMASRAELEARKGGNTTARYLAYARVDRDLFGSQSGDVEILFNEDMLPTEAVAKDIVLFGDVRGRLVRMGFGMGLIKGASPARAASP
ncbi:MAG: DUF3108 domain-containing protein [Deltaproteobacteria bacterium]|nr:DUF3108 domain-containing protein [Deltaproteobacteria bacterium]